ncbi:hypothetical protein D9M71_767320 [compost metagenome]
MVPGDVAECVRLVYIVVGPVGHRHAALLYVLKVLLLLGPALSIEPEYETWPVASLTTLFRCFLGVVEVGFHHDRANHARLCRGDPDDASANLRVVYIA